MIHPADSGLGIAHTGRNAGSQDRGDHGVGIVADAEFALAERDVVDLTPVALPAAS